MLENLPGTPLQGLSETVDPLRAERGRFEPRRRFDELVGTDDVPAELRAGSHGTEGSP